MKTDNQEGVIVFGERRIPYVLHRSGRKNLRIVVNPDLGVSVYAPLGAGAKEIEEALFRKVRWIAKTLDTIESFRPLPTPKKYVSGETFVYLGRQYRLKVICGATGAAKLSGRYLVVSVPDKLNRKEIEKRVDRWYREHAKAVFERYLSKCSIVAARHGVSKGTLCIRKMNRRWGSCAASGRITLNIALVQAPVHCIEYVVMHEICHLKHHDHSPNFYRLLTRCLPDWRPRKETLDKFKLV